MSNQKAGIGATLTVDNLQAIYEAMSKIKEIDRSNYFNNYLKEVLERIDYATQIEQILKQEAQTKKG